MKIYFRQIYIVPGVSFPFSLHFQRHLSDEITALITPSEHFVKKYGEDWDLIFTVSAKHDIQNTEIRGPSVYRKDKDVEFTIFLPFATIQRETLIPRSAVGFLLQTVCSVLVALGISTANIMERQTALAERICADPAMFKQP